MKIFLMVVLLLQSLMFISCSGDAPEKVSKDLKPGKGIIEQKQHEIATDAVKAMKDPVDKARAVSGLEDERNKDINKASGN